MSEQPLRLLLFEHVMSRPKLAQFSQLTTEASLNRLGRGKQVRSR